MNSPLQHRTTITSLHPLEWLTHNLSKTELV